MGLEINPTGALNIEPFEERIYMMPENLSRVFISSYKAIQRGGYTEFVVLSFDIESRKYGWHESMNWFLMNLNIPKMLFRRLNPMGAVEFGLDSSS